MTCSELDVDRTLELARTAREPSAVDEQRVLDALRSHIDSSPQRQSGGRATCRLHLVGDTRSPRRGIPDLEEVPSGDGPVWPNLGRQTIIRARSECIASSDSDALTIEGDNAPPRR